MINVSRPFAVFDIDGTVMRWQFLHAIIDALGRHSFIEKSEYQKIRDARATWKKRSRSESFHEYEAVLVEVWLATLPRITRSQYDSAVTESFETYKDQVYVYARELIRDLKAQNYLSFAISGSPIEAVEKFAHYYGFDEFFGTTHHETNGKFTGEIDLVVGKKHAILQDLIQKYRAEIRGSIGVGDTKGDIEMLQITEQPIAFNPDKGLYTHARQQSWRIVVERKSVVYELDKKDGQFILA